MERALAEFRVSGIHTSIGFHRELLRHPQFAASENARGFAVSEIGENFDAEVIAEIAIGGKSEVDDQEKAYADTESF